jgi:hypothetical protein
MHAELIAVPIVFIVVYLLVLSTGFLIRQGVTSLIAGYDASQVRDEKGLARWAGSGVMGIGVIGLGCAASMFAFPDAMFIFVIAATVVSVVGAVALVATARRFLK